MKFEIVLNPRMYFPIEFHQVTHPHSTRRFNRRVAASLASAALFNQRDHVAGLNSSLEKYAQRETRRRYEFSRGSEVAATTTVSLAGISSSVYSLRLVFGESFSFFCFSKRLHCFANDLRCNFRRVVSKAMKILSRAWNAPP